jgi:hypothetical protein
MGNRLKEQLGLFTGRLSTHTLRANLLRLYFSYLTYVLAHAPRRLAVKGTEWVVARVGIPGDGDRRFRAIRVGRIRLRLLEID